jgi:signal transduction histidine kinase
LLSPQTERSSSLQRLIESNPAFAAWCHTSAQAHGHKTTDDLPVWIPSRLPELLGSLDEFAPSSCEGRDWHSALRLAVEHSRRLEGLEADFNGALQRAKLDALKELAYGASHEINNPLANISLRAQTLLGGETDPERRRKLAQIHAQALRAHEMIADLMLFARPPKLKPARVDVLAIVQSQLVSLQERAVEQGTRLEPPEAEQLHYATVDALQLGVAVRALVINALEAIGAGGAIQIRIHRSQPAASGNETGETVAISVIDNGSGVPASAESHLFDPFFSGREAGRGLGFGLTKAWRIITDHGGDIRQHPTPGGGATFVISLPPSK